MFRFRMMPAVLCASFLTLAVSPAYCTGIATYSTLTDWDTAVSGIQTIDFESIPGGSGWAGGQNVFGSGFFADGVEFLGFQQPLDMLSLVDTSMGALGSPNFGTKDALSLYLGGGTSAAIKILLPGNVSALAFNAFTTFPAASALTLTVNGQMLTVPTTGFPALTFFGLTSDTPITEVDVTGVSRAFIDNFSIATVGAADAPPDPTPEAATYILIGSGLVVMAIRRKRIRDAQKLDMPWLELVLLG